MVAVFFTGVVEAGNIVCNKYPTLLVALHILFFTKYIEWIYLFFHIDLCCINDFGNILGVICGKL